MSTSQGSHNRNREKNLTKKLAQETKEMEERLAALRNSMNKQRTKKEKDGYLWKASTHSIEAVDAGVQRMKITDKRQPTQTDKRQTTPWEKPILHKASRGRSSEADTRPEEETVPVGTSLLDGVYDEGQAAQGFQSALSEWRNPILHTATPALVTREIQNIQVQTAQVEQARLDVRRSLLHDILAKERQRVLDNLKVMQKDITALRNRKEAFVFAEDEDDVVE